LMRRRRRFFSLAHGFPGVACPPPAVAGFLRRFRPCCLTQVSFPSEQRHLSDIISQWALQCPLGTNVNTFNTTMPTSRRSRSHRQQGWRKLPSLPYGYLPISYFAQSRANEK
jgi:hypothetical protein